jgi:hypothetical protein
LRSCLLHPERLELNQRSKRRQSSGEAANNQTSLKAGWLEIGDHHQIQFCLV